MILFAAGLTVAHAQNEFIKPGDNLIVEGVPDIPAALAAEIGRYTEFRSAALASWHPTRREMLITTRFAETNQIHLVKCPGGARTQLTFFPDGASGASYQPTRGDYFVFSSAVGGDEQYQKYCYDFASGAVTLLTDGASRNTGGVWSSKGDSYAYQSTRRNGRDVDIWIMHPDPYKDHLLAELSGGGWAAIDFSPDDRQLLVSEYISINESYLWLMDAATGEKTLITPKGEEKVSYGRAQFSRDGKGLYATTDRDAEFRRLAYIDLATKEHFYLTDAIDWDVEYFALSWDGKTIAFVTNEDGLSVLHLYDVENRRELPAPELPAGILGSLEWHRNNCDLGFALQSSRSSYDVHSLNVKTGVIERWTESETGINTADFSPPQVVRWPSFDGRMISGLYYRPPAQFIGRRPVIIDIHGGPEGQARPGFQREDNYFIHELGIAIIQPNVRGSSGYGKTFLKLDNGFLRQDSYKDIAALLDWIATRPDLDAERIMVTGGSYGGHMTLAIAAFYPDRIRCALDVVGISSLVTFLENTSAYRRDLRRVEYGDERDPAMREFLDRIAPLNHADQITKPLFVVQGGNDPRVPLSEAEQIVRTVRKNGTPVWYLMARDEGHGFAKKKNRDFLLYATALFIKEHLLNE
ncbi:S9 family peptidase [candidate division KSB1 bacterium]|nr:S9 family peptidase [candidate division KSB1 bacterium]RQW07563.1 MAG: S9 family peptidase [candidate division KSB1 bacterium]